MYPIIDQSSPLSLQELSKYLLSGTDLVKVDVDINQQRMIIGMELHVDGEEILLESGSLQSDLRGINLYPDQWGTEDFIEYDSMINIRPRDNNRSRDVEDIYIRQQICDLVLSLITT